MFFYLYLILGFPLLLVFCFFINSVVSKNEEDIKNLKVQIEDLDLSFGRQKNRTDCYIQSFGMLQSRLYECNQKIDKLQNELKKLKKEIKK